jgi:hypothetical protein
MSDLQDRFDSCGKKAAGKKTLTGSAAKSAVYRVVLL